MKGSARFMAIGIIGIILILVLLPKIPTSGSVVKIGDVKLYDAEGKLVGTVKADGVLPGAFIGPPEDQAVTAIMPVDFTIRFNNAKDTPVSPTVKVYLVDSGLLVGSAYDLLETDEVILGQVTVSGSWVLVSGDDYEFSDGVSFDINAEEMEDYYHREYHRTIEPGDRFKLAAIVQADATPFSVAARSSNTVTLQFSESPQAELIITKVSIG